MNLDFLKNAFRSAIFPETAVICHDPGEALAYIDRFYTQALEAFKESGKQHTLDQDIHQPDFMGVYPYIGCWVGSQDIPKGHIEAYGMASEAGYYGVTATQPHLLKNYYEEQLRLLMENHKIPVMVAKSRSVIPVPFIVDILADLWQYPFSFPPDMLRNVNDDIINSKATEPCPHGTLIRPLAPFTAERVDYSLNRLYHYCGTHPEHFQNFVLLTNYQRYMKDFIQYGRQEIQAGNYDALVGPGDTVLDRALLEKEDGWEESIKKMGQKWSTLQMPTYHLKKACGNGITFINIGVGPSNAKNITDHLAVLRPHCWIMLGHCAGLRADQNLGDYVLAHGYVRDDGVLDDELPLWIPIPPMAEIQQALFDSTKEVLQIDGQALKSRVRTGSVISTGNRNWELQVKNLDSFLNQSRAVALDMESATIATNGFRFRVPYGALLCVSDKPLHGELKLRGMAQKFYKDQISQHLKVGLTAIQALQQNSALMHSRKLRGFREAPFR